MDMFYDLSTVLSHSKSHEWFWNSASEPRLLRLVRFTIPAPPESITYLHLTPQTLIVPQADEQLDETEDKSEDSYTFISRNCIDSAVRRGSIS